MIFLQVTTNPSSINYVMLFGTLAMLSLTLGIVFFVIFHQRKVIRFNDQLKKLEDDKQQILLNASIKFQEEERNRIAADLHDDVGPLLATARLYLNENLVNQEPAEIYEAILTCMNEDFYFNDLVNKAVMGKLMQKKSVRQHYGSTTA